MDCRSLEIGDTVGDKSRVTFVDVVPIWASVGDGSSGSFSLTATEEEGATCNFACAMVGKYKMSYQSKRKCPKCSCLSHNQH